MAVVFQLILGCVNNMEKIIGVSIKYGGQQFSLLRPNRHMHVYEYLISPKYPDIGTGDENIIEGFITSELRFLDRVDGMELVKNNGQLTGDPFQEKELFSEDIW